MYAYMFRIELWNSQAEVCLAGTGTDWLQILITFGLNPVSTSTTGYHLLCHACGSQQLAKLESLQTIFIVTDETTYGCKTIKLV